MENEKIKVLFVCLGNICRSPMAKAIFEYQVRQRGISAFFEVDSCGTGPWHAGENADPRTLQTLKMKKIPINHIARQIKPVDLIIFDYILCMDSSNLHNVTIMADRNTQSKIMLMRDFDNESTGKEVPDPYWDSRRGFENVFEILNRSIANFIDFLIKEHKLPVSS